MNRHTKRKVAALKRARARATARMIDNPVAFKELVDEAIAKDEMKVVELVLLRTAYRAFKRNRITARQARLFGCTVRGGKK